MRNNVTNCSRIQWYDSETECSKKATSANDSSIGANTSYAHASIAFSSIPLDSCHIKLHDKVNKNHSHQIA